MNRSAARWLGKMLTSPGSGTAIPSADGSGSFTDLYRRIPAPAAATSSTMAITLHVIAAPVASLPAAGE